MAAESAEVVDALAYTVGRDIVFGRGRYQPGTDLGRSLLTHELTHVVQQSRVSMSPGANVMMGNPSDDAERHAEAVDRHPTLRRRASKSPETWAGQFIADPYDAQVETSPDGTIDVGYGATIDLKFKASPLVDADEIAFVQTAQTVKDDAPYDKFALDPDEKKRKTAESRRIPQGKQGAGAHIDQFPTSATPVYGMQTTPGQTRLSGGKPAPTTTVGWHYTDSAGALKNKDAWMHDEPDLNSGDLYTPASQLGEWSQRFETAALALSGPQVGTFYGSVEWGWLKNVADTQPRVLDFKLKSPNLPSPLFVDAAKAWNASVTSDQTKAIDVPVEQLHTTPKSTVLWDSPARRSKVATLPKDTMLTRRRTPSASFFSVKAWVWASVVVVSGPHAKKTGWVLEGDIAP